MTTRRVQSMDSRIELRGEWGPSTTAHLESQVHFRIQDTKQYTLNLVIRATKNLQTLGCRQHRPPFG
jgi:hypothetical protein